MQIMVTERLDLSLLTPEDAVFVLELVNEPDWLRYIGDRGVHTLEDARGYIRNGPMNMYARLGFALHRVALKSNGESIGICGLIKRDALPDVDLGFAFLERFRGQGYAWEAASATLAYAKDTLGLKRVVAITTPDNTSSVQLLEKLGFRFEQTLKLPGSSADSKLFAYDY